MQRQQDLKSKRLSRSSKRWLNRPVRESKSSLGKLKSEKLSY